MDMMCDECGVRPATIRLTTIVNGEKHDRNLCSECLARSQQFKQDFSALAGRLNGLLDALKSGVSRPEEPVPDIQCTVCGMTYEQFHKTGMLGCAQCYTSFRELIQNMLSRTHGQIQHTGRTPGTVDKKLSVKLKIEKLRQDLSRAIFDEEYEIAARLRDEIRTLEAGIPREDDIHE